ncbi:MAG TPA: polysaccharide biosynthesis tyrosine autokinase [Ruminococcus sp.]|nr:polysaccharide biosynthesis tyrosine autokinase [Ruminococcus sp.]
MNESYSIKDIIRLMLNHIWLILVIAVLGAVGGFCVSKFILPLEYSSHITMYVQSYTGITENNANDINNSISNSKQLVNTYMEVLKDDAVMNAVGEQIVKQFDNNTLNQNFKLTDTGKITPSSIRACLAISSVTDTSAVKVTATTKNAEVAAAICNDLTKVAPQYVEDAVGVGSINTIDTAKVYNTPVAPNTPKNTMIGGAASFMLIVLIIFLIDFFDNTIKDSDALANKYKKAIIGEIQQFGDSKKKRSSDEDEHAKLTDKEVPFFIVESYKSIRTNVTFSLSTFDKKIFAVSSSNPGEGKSTTSANIAIAMAQSGSKVLLIDADMRKSVQHKIFGIKNKKGLSSAVSKMSSLEDCIQKNVMENLDVLTAGPIPPNPSELLGSEQMTVILNELSEKYAVIIIDTPPVNVVTDAMELAKNISGIIMVVRYAVTTDEDVAAAYKKIEFAQMNLLGFIVNSIKHKHHGGYYSKYKYSGKYYYKKGYGYGYYGNKPETNDAEKSDEEIVADTEKVINNDTDTSAVVLAGEPTNAEAAPAEESSEIPEQLKSIVPINQEPTVEAESYYDIKL